MYFLFLVSAFCEVKNFSDINELNSILKPFLAVDDSIKSVEYELYKFFNNSNLTISLSSNKENCLQIQFNDPTNNILPKCLGRLINIKTLILKNNGLNELPEFFEKFISLYQLDLSSNDFDKLPKVLFSLKNLTHLYLHKNKFKSIEDNIKNFKELKVLNFSGNNISHVSEQLKNLINLASLNLSWNENIIRINVKDIDHKKDVDFLKKIPESVEFLYINNIRLRHIPWYLKFLGNLLILNVKKNLLKAPFRSFNKLISVLEHDKSLNNYKNPASWIYPLMKLKKLKLNSNKICGSFLIEEHMLPALEKLNLTLCYITRFEVEGYNIMDSSTGEYIKYENPLTINNSQLSNNALYKNNSKPSIIYSLQHLSITITNTYVVPNLLIFPNLLCFRIINKEKSYRNINPDKARSLFNGLSKMELLEKLDLFGFNFISIPQSIFNLKNLEYLSINNCKIKEIPDEIIILSNLNKIALTYNNITNINTKLFDLKTPIKIILTKNPFHYLPPTINNDNLSFKLKMDGLQMESFKKDNNKLGIMDISYKKIHQVSLQNFLDMSSMPIEYLYKKSHEEEHKWELDQMLKIKNKEVKESQNDYNVIENYWNILEKYITDTDLKDKFSNYLKFLYEIKEEREDETLDLIENIKKYAEAICEILKNLINKGNTKIIEKIIIEIRPGLSGCILDQAHHFSYAYHLLIGDENKSAPIEYFIYNKIALLKYHVLRKIIINNNEEQNIHIFLYWHNRLSETLGLPFILPKYGINTENSFLKCKEYIIYQFFKLMSVENVVKDLYESINKSYEGKIMAYEYISNKKNESISLKEYVEYQGYIRNIKITNINNKGIYFILKEVKLIKNVRNKITNENI